MSYTTFRSEAEAIAYAALRRSQGRAAYWVRLRHDCIEVRSW